MRATFFGAPPGRRIPRLSGFDQSLQFLADPYRWISRQCRRLGSDVVQGRLLLQPTICLSGPEAAELFYDKRYFQRAGAAPEPVRATLFGKGTVQSLDGAEHLHRKRFFLTWTGPLQTEALVEAADETWYVLATEWERRDRQTLYEMMQEWLTRAVLAWAGIAVPEAEMQRRREQIVALFNSGANGLAGHLRARRARRELQAWLGEMVDSARGNGEPFALDSPAEAAILLGDRDGLLLPSQLAAAELLNLLRPVVAVSVYIVLAVHALRVHAQARRLPLADDMRLEAFVQEVRRFYPFFPAVAARTIRAFTWNGLQFPKGVRALLDLYGTNHDPRVWPEPDAFRPERFIGAAPGLFGFVPQGGARAEDHHRCPGEGITVALMELALRRLAACRFELPSQDMSIDFGSMPALPHDRLLITRFKMG